MVLQTIGDIEVVGEAAHGAEALAVIAKTAPDVVLADARMPVMDGVELVTACRKEHPGLPVIVLTTFDDDELVRAAMEAGAAGFVLKDSSPADLADAVTAALEGGLVVDRRVARALVSRPSDPLATLTPTERLVAAAVARGATNAEIAEELVVTEGTVKNHVSAILRKLGHRDRMALALALQPSRE